VIGFLIGASIYKLQVVRGVGLEELFNGGEAREEGGWKKKEEELENHLLDLRTYDLELFS